MITDGKESTPHSPASERPRSFRHNSTSNGPGINLEEDKGRPTKWSMGVLNDPETHEVPGSVLLLTGQRNEPLGLRNAPARTSASSLPSQIVSIVSRKVTGKKLTKDGAIILEPQPDDSHNDPLNWPTWKRDSALLSLGLYCMVGGGMTPILAAGFTNVAATYNVSTPKVALTTGLYMMGLGVGSVFASPTAILYGKRPVYLFGAIMFICTAVWCAASPSYNSLLVARIFQGISLSPVECLPSATIAEIFFLHERAYRIGIYTLLLLGGKNLVPLVSAAVIQSLGWRWVFWIVAMVGGFCWCLLFLFVPETFWDRTPVPKSRAASRSPSKLSIFKHRKASHGSHVLPKANAADLAEATTDMHHEELASLPADPIAQPSTAHRPTQNLHVVFAPEELRPHSKTSDNPEFGNNTHLPLEAPATPTSVSRNSELRPLGTVEPRELDSEAGSTQTPVGPGSLANGHAAPIVPPVLEDRVELVREAPATPGLHNFNSPFYHDIEKTQSDYIGRGRSISKRSESPPSKRYTTGLRDAPKQTFVQQLKPWNGRLHNDEWLRVAIRPFILFAYPAVLWSSIVYACSIGWLIVLSESVAVVYRTRTTYNFSALSTGLVYISPFIGGILGTAVAGKVSDVMVRAMSKRNGGLYEPEFRLVMAIPVTVTTVIGLMGFGWSAQEHDLWIVPTVFFGIISFGCSLGSTTAITFCVDSYRQYAGEALVTLNFSKNIFHGLVFSLFFTSWLESDGSRKVFIWVGVIQLILMAFTVPMYIYGKRFRMWTARKNLMEKF